MNTHDKYVGKVLDGRYEVLEVIGEGGMAVVYKALCHRLNRYDAIKIMRDDTMSDEEFRRRFCAEAHAVAMLSHPNIVAVYDVSHSYDIEYIVMELVEGITLKQYMDRKGAVNWRECLHFSRQICKALAHAHERGIIHRDIKPHNIMLLRDGTIKVADFGIAALENEISENQGQAVGSIHYIAPEQARGANPDARSDIYSLGVVMYEMLTGVKPFNGSSINEIAVMHMNADPVPPHDLIADIPAELEAIALKAMNRDIKARYQSASELLQDMEDFIQSQSREDDAEEYENPAVMPVRSVSELSREKYKLRRRRSSRVSFLSGMFAVLLSIVLLVAFVWDFWLDDVFSPAVRIDLPDFVGSNYEEIIQNPELMELYSFEFTFVVDPDTAPGTIISQNPNEGRSMMLTPTGIQVELTVSTGLVLTQVPDVINLDYRDAVNILQQAGFPAEIENTTSDTVEKNVVMASSPQAGEEITTGTTVYLTVSSGTEISYMTMPNLIGLSENAAVVQIENYGLSYGGAERVTSDLQAGTVIGQSVEAFTPVEEHSKIILTVSRGPEA